MEELERCADYKIRKQFSAIVNQCITTTDESDFLLIGQDSKDQTFLSVLFIKNSSSTKKASVN